jgi:predicted NAD-dependent protein-ADP-ribosyltransferase YbiA (DUF1768 family)
MAVLTREELVERIYAARTAEECREVLRQIAEYRREHPDDWRISLMAEMPARLLGALEVIGRADQR